MGKGGRTRILTTFERGVRWQCVCSQRCVVTAAPCVRTSHRPGEGLRPGNMTSHWAAQAWGTAPRCVRGSVPRGPPRRWDHTSVPSPCSFRSASHPQHPSLLKQVTGFPCFSRLRYSQSCGRSAVGFRSPDSGTVASCPLSALHTVLPWTWPRAEGGHPCDSRAPSLVTRAAVERLVTGRSAGVTLQAHHAPRANLWTRATALLQGRGGSDAVCAAGAHPRRGHLRPLLTCHAGSGLHGASCPSPAACHPPSGQSAPQRLQALLRDKGLLHRERSCVAWFQQCLLWGRE